MNAPLGGTMPWTDDIDQICSYLTSVRLDSSGAGGKGIRGAVVLDADGLPWGVGAQSFPDFMEQAPRIQGQLQDAAAQSLLDARAEPDFILVQDPQEFLFCKKFLGCYYVVVSGSRGSFELFQGRIDRCVQMAEAALKERKRS
jgi:hypothetical protein